MDPATLTPRCVLPRVRACCPAKPHAGSCPCQEEARLGAVGPWPRFPDSCCLCPLGLRAGRPCQGKLRFRAGTSSHTTPRPSKYSQHSWAQLHSESLTRAHLSHHWSLGRVTLREGTLHLGHFTSPSRGWRQRATSAWGWGLPPPQAAVHTPAAGMSGTWPHSPQGWPPWLGSLCPRENDSLKCPLAGLLSAGHT